jgi:hypothetical protein
MFSWHTLICNWSPHSLGRTLSSASSIVLLLSVRCQLDSICNCCSPLF